MPVILSAGELQPEPQKMDWTTVLVRIVPP